MRLPQLSVPPFLVKLSNTKLFKIIFSIYTFKLILLAFYGISGYLFYTFTTSVNNPENAFGDSVIKSQYLYLGLTGLICSVFSLPLFFHFKHQLPIFKLIFAFAGFFFYIISTIENIVDYRVRAYYYPSFSRWNYDGDLNDPPPSIYAIIYFPLLVFIIVLLLIQIKIAISRLANKLESVEVVKKPLLTRILLYSTIALLIFSLLVSWFGVIYPRIADCEIYMSKYKENNSLYQKGYNFYYKGYYNVCYLGETQYVNYGKVEDADYHSFPSSQVEGDVASDRYSVFYRGRKVDADVDSLEKFRDDDCFKDKNNVFLNGKKVEFLDAKSFEVYPSSQDSCTEYSHDKNGVYYDFEKIEGADEQSFQVGKYWMKENFGLDKNNVYRFGKKIEGADPKTYFDDENNR